jgi:hypothetical protein
MAVCLDKPRHHTAVNIERLRPRPDPVLDVGPVADRDDATVGHGQGFGGGLEFVDGEYGSENDQVS